MKVLFQSHKRIAKSKKSFKKILAIPKSMEIVCMSNLINFHRKAPTFHLEVSRILIIIIVRLSIDQTLNIIIENQAWWIEYNKIKQKTRFSSRKNKIKKEMDKKKTQLKNKKNSRYKILPLLAPLPYCNQRSESFLQNWYPPI